MARRLYRSRTNRWVAGAAGGLAAFLRVDATIVRLGFALAALWNGFGILLYIAMVLIVPEEPLEEPATEGPLPPPALDPESLNRNVGILLVLGGVYFLVRTVPVVSSYVRESVIAFLLIVAGLALLLLRRPAP